MATRNTKTKPTITEPVTDQGLHEDISVTEMLRAMGMEVPSGRRMIAGFVASTTTALGLGWLTGEIVGFLYVGAMLMSANTFLAMVLAIVGFALGIYASAIIASRVGVYVASGQLEADARRAKDAVMGLIKKPSMPAFLSKKTVH